MNSFMIVGSSRSRALALGVPLVLAACAGSGSVPLASAPPALIAPVVAPARTGAPTSESDAPPPPGLPPDWKFPAAA